MLDISNGMLQRLDSVLFPPKGVGFFYLFQEAVNLIGLKLQIPSGGHQCKSGFFSLSLTWAAQGLPQARMLQKSARVWGRNYPWITGSLLCLLSFEGSCPEGCPLSLQDRKSEGFLLEFPAGSWGFFNLFFQGWYLLSVGRSVQSVLTQPLLIEQNSIFHLRKDFKFKKKSKAHYSHNKRQALRDICVSINNHLHIIFHFVSNL